MIELGLPLMLLLLPLPLLVRWLLPAAPEGRGGALRVPFYAALCALPGGAGGEGRRGRTALVLKSLAWIFLVLAATQPRWLGEPRAVTSHGRDLMSGLPGAGVVVHQGRAQGCALCIAKQQGRRGAVHA